MTEEQIKRLTNKKLMLDVFSFSGMFIMLYEESTVYFMDNLKYFLCDFNGPENVIESEKYKRLISKRKGVLIDEPQKTNKCISTFLWFLDNEIITKEEFELFLVARDYRNDLAHRILEISQNGVNEKDVNLYANMYILVKKMDNWWINNIELSLLDEKIEEPIDYENTISYWLALYGIVFDTMYKS